MQDPKIEKIKGPNNSEVSFCPNRGGIITSLKFNDKEIFYLDEVTFKNKENSVRGGIPILFPNAGELIDNKVFPGLKRHGFARDMCWQFEAKDDYFKETISSDDSTFEIYPYDFKLSIIGSFKEDGSFVLKQEIENREKEKDLPISMGIHPYFKVSNIEKGYIKFNFEGGRYIEDQVSVWSNGGTVYVDNPKLKNPDASIEIEIPSLGTIVFDISPVFQTIWIWSMPGKDFICVEPMMRGLNGLIDDPVVIKPECKINTSINLKIK